MDEQKEVIRDLKTVLNDLRYVINHAWDRLDGPEFNTLTSAATTLRKVIERIEKE